MSRLGSIYLPRCRWRIVYRWRFGLIAAMKSVSRSRPVSTSCGVPRRPFIRPNSSPIILMISCASCGTARRVRSSKPGSSCVGPGAEFPLARLRQLLGDRVRVLDDAFRVCSAGRDAAGLFMRPEMDELTVDERTVVANFAHWVSKEADALLRGLAAMRPDLRASFAMAILT